MTNAIGSTVLGAPVDRVDGPVKVAGAAKYPSDVTLPGLVHAALVHATIAVGTITRIDTARAEAAPGVLAVITHENAPRLPDGPMTQLGPSPQFPLNDDRVLYHRQPVAIVVAQTREQATSAARLVKLSCEESQAILGIGNPLAPVVADPAGLDTVRGDAAAALASAEVVYDQEFTIAAETNNPLGLFATVAHWEGDRLTVHDSTQWPAQTRTSLATIFSVPEENVRVLIPYLGGGFGAGLRTWPHTVLTVLAARTVNRPVKLVLTRPEMFTAVGHRTQTAQRLRLGANRDGRLLAIDHEATSTQATEEFNIEPITLETPSMYACENLATRNRQVRLSIPGPGPMRAPGTVQGNFLIESALDELSYQLAVDPIELRLRNYAEVDPRSGRPWSSKALRECYRVGAQRFGWGDRNPEIGSMRDGNQLIGYGMAGVTFGQNSPACQVKVSISRDGTALVRSAATDMGTGTYTIATQLAAELLGLGLGQVRVEIGDSDLPPAPASGGSQQATALAGAIHNGAGRLVQAFLDLAAGDEQSPLRGRQREDVTVTDGRIHLAGDPSSGETYRDILTRHGMDELVVDGAIDPQPAESATAPAGAFTAVFAEVRVDRDLGVLRVARLVSVIDGGRVLNGKTARSQIIGATVMAIGMTLLEETVFDPGTGRIANATFGDYLVPVNADVPDIDVVFVGEPDRFSPIGAKGLGEVGTVGVSAAIANAVYHATGRRIRSLPITLDKLL
jgi:xanthine dehydrogenase YagR molybdenum-binding subunit